MPRLGIQGLENKLKTIEQAAEFHALIASHAPHPGGLLQHITSSQGWASNQETHSVTFTTRIAPDDVPTERRNAFHQGFFCIEINITAKWGGCRHSGERRTETEVTVHVLDRLAGGMAQGRWETSGAWGAAPISDDEVLPLLRNLLAKP